MVSGVSLRLTDSHVVVLLVIMGDTAIWCLSSTNADSIPYMRPPGKDVQDHHFTKAAKPLTAEEAARVKALGFNNPAGATHHTEGFIRYVHGSEMQWKASIRSVSQR